MSNRKHSSLYLVSEVARWEFRRWFKLNEQVITFLVGIVLSILIFGGKTIADKFSNKEIKVAVINSSILPVNVNQETKIKLLIKDHKELQKQLTLLEQNKIEGILIIKSIDSSELIVNKEPGWLKHIQNALNLSRQQIKLKESNISAEILNDIFKGSEIKLSLTETPKGKSTVGEKIAAGVLIGLMFAGVFLGLAYQFVAITGEKQLRITEVIISAISPQTWIDGKILGISLLSMALLVTYSLSGLAFIAISSIFGSGWSVPIVLANPFLLITLLLFAICGFLFWNTFFSAVAATINDPNTSARGSLIMLPGIPAVTAFFALGNPDSITMKVLSIFPLTSAPVISARLVLTDVPLIEIASSLILLVLSTWYLRIAAGRIFALSVLMYGKEPSLKEISKWIKTKHI